MENEQSKGDAPKGTPFGEPVQEVPSIIDTLRAKRDEAIAAEVPTLVLDVPAYGDPSPLVVRYTYPEGGYESALKAAEVEFGKGPNARLNGNIDLLRTCCDEVLGRVGGELQRLVPNDPLKLTFDDRLAELLKIDVPAEVRNRGRFIVRNLFSPRAAKTGRYEGDLAIIRTGNEVYRWLSGAVSEVDEQLVGE